MPNAVADAQRRRSLTRQVGARRATIDDLLPAAFSIADMKLKMHAFLLLLYMTQRHFAIWVAS